MRYCLVLALIISIGSASNYVTNGDFEQDLTVGWFQANNGTGITITRGTTYDPDPDYEVNLYKYGTGTTGMGHATIYQVADIPTRNIDLSFDAKMTAYDNYVGIWAASGVFVGYMDASSNMLGETRIYYATDECPWMNSATQHLIPVTDNNWHSYSINVADELIYMPGIDPSQVSKIKVTVIDTMVSC
jgi:hypothetical protein